MSQFQIRLVLSRNLGRLLHPHLSLEGPFPSPKTRPSRAVLVSLEMMSIRVGEGGKGAT